MSEVAEFEYTEDRTLLTNEFVALDSTVFLTSGAGAGATTMSFVRVGVEFGAPTGLDEVSGLVRSVWFVSAGWFIGLLEPEVTTLGRS